MSKFNLRAAQIEDLSTLEKLEQAVVTAERPFNSEIKENGVKYYDLKQLITDKNSYLVVIESEEKIIATGYAQIRTSKAYLTHQRHAYLGFMFVDPHFRGQGLNQLVINDLINWSTQQGIHDFYLDVYSANQSAINAYHKLGFKPSLLEMTLHR